MILKNNKKFRKMFIVADLVSLSLSNVISIMLIIVKMPTNVGILTLMSRINFVSMEKKFYNLGEGGGGVSLSLSTLHI